MNAGAHIDYYFWLNSDWAYLGADRLDALARRTGVEIRHKPVDLPEVYARTGGVLLGQRSAQRQRYRVVELERWCRKLGLHVNPTPRYMCPDAELASRIVIAADELGLPVLALYKAILRAEWCEDLDISAEPTLQAILARLGLDGSGVMELARARETGMRYRRYTDEAVGAGVFGSPAYVFEGELFWGQDRLDMLEEAIRARRPARTG
ncbi:2-hydroxychromene-2-carboxylate isomerase [Cupriavidus alkaliphilus]|uniref:2-hydroxychromene-2-carboxylate isomerase n=1 Tax=Cupriavidus alkaliphilus TaxID=942866 RepID=A0A7W4YRQ0_9BURK|nr:2-hydroxychromene-2-carboxylate isomerase [Cupriavidus alkaliphilus]MBB3009060.1 2-hydroxychromene-2-carboxylate isomerase [Cupriavidus alkaliphilus]PVY79462.1 2-hydroxychromene-2-carboxylate isomerase [Cupriavidus alkaliphilus]